MAYLATEFIYREKKANKIFANKSPSQNIYSQLYRCIPAEEKFNKISIMPGNQDFLQGHGMLKKIIDDALEELDNLKLKYEIE